MHHGICVQVRTHLKGTWQHPPRLLIIAAPTRALGLPTRLLWGLLSSALPPGSGRGCVPVIIRTAPSLQQADVLCYSAVQSGELGRVTALLKPALLRENWGLSPPRRVLCGPQCPCCRRISYPWGNVSRSTCWAAVFPVSPASRLPGSEAGLVPSHVKLRPEPGAAELGVRTSLPQCQARGDHI